MKPVFGKALKNSVRSTTSGADWIEYIVISRGNTAPNPIHVGPVISEVICVL